MLSGVSTPTDKARIWTKTWPWNCRVCLVWSILGHSLSRFLFIVLPCMRGAGVTCKGVRASNVEHFRHFKAWRSTVHNRYKVTSYVRPVTRQPRCGLQNPGRKSVSAGLWCVLKSELQKLTEDLLEKGTLIFCAPKLWCERNSGSKWPAQVTDAQAWLASGKGK